MKKIMTASFIILVLIQFIPVKRDNPKSDPTLEIILETETKIIIEKACYDCHSNKTNWPWYSYVAPLSFIVANHVKEARHELNFSLWQTYSKKRKSKKLSELVEEVEEGEMPLFPYPLIHPRAKLSKQEIDILISWAKNDSLYISK